MFTSVPNLKSLEIVLKTVERCNINCSYCYFFNGSDDSYKAHPPYISQKTIENVSDFLSQGCKDLSLKFLHVIFHGGEPLMQKKSDFDRMCAYFYEKLSSSVKLFFSLQTNAILVDSEWINLFSKHNVGIGVSIDGPKEYNDLFRVDHRKRGTYDRVFKGLQILNEAATAKLIKEIGLICVVNPDHDGQKIYRHFIDVLKVSHLDFLLPDLTHDLFEGDKKQESYSRYLTAIFYEWLQDDNPNVEIRLFNSLIKSLTNVDLQRNYSDQGLSDGMVLVISSNGDIAPDDVLKNTQVWTQEDEINVRDTSLKEYLEYKTLISIQASKLSSPSTCKQCCWENICKGGSLIHRFSKENGFNNASVFCNTLKNLYSHIANYLLSSGVTLDTIKNILRLA